MAASMSITWTLAGAGWAECRVEDMNGYADSSASYIGAGPESFICAVTSLVLGDTVKYADFYDEPGVFRWSFTRERSQVTIRLFWACDEARIWRDAELLWTTQQPLAVLARATIRAFDQVKQNHDDPDYLEQWRRPFPHEALEGLRTAWRDNRDTINTP